MRLRFIHDIHLIDAPTWDALWPGQYPFVRHAFLDALQTSHSIDTAVSGWRSHHALIEEEGRLLAALPLFEKWHSYGEYVFDWAWAGAYQQAGLRYYPKLLGAIPFTPASGPRLGLLTDLSGDDRQRVVASLLDGVWRRCREGYSGWHCLFPAARDAALLRAQLPHQRRGVQFHWFNTGYTSFEDFLARFSSRKRKNLLKERAQVLGHGLDLRMRSGRELDAGHWQQFARLYRRTYLKRSGHGGYLGEDFFARVASAMPDQVLLASAERAGELLAGALYFRDEDTLYGRYWGSRENFDGLHFELCYYQGIDYAIRQGLARFDPGAQGEHKIQRGFTPVYTTSLHRLVHPGFDTAIGRFVAEEASQIAAYLADCRGALPFREGEPCVSAEILISDMAQVF